MAKVKYVLLLPLTYNDGTRVPKKVREQIEEELFVLAGGYRFGAPGKGAYRMKSGNKKIDITQEVWIAVEVADEPALKELVGKIAARLGQESMWLERVESTVEFILPTSIGSQSHENKRRKTPRSRSRGRKGRGNMG